MSYINHRGGWPELGPELESGAEENSNIIARGVKQIGSFLGRLTLDHRDMVPAPVPQKLYDDIEYFSENGIFPDEVSCEEGDIPLRRDTEQ